MQRNIVSLRENSSSPVMGWELIKRERTGTAPFTKKKEEKLKSKNIILLCNIIQLSQMETENAGLVKPYSLLLVFLNVQEKMLRKNVSILFSAQKTSWILKKGYRRHFLTEHKNKLTLFQLSDLSRNFSAYFIITSVT